jgi:hypothetical protein
MRGASSAIGIIQFVPMRRGAIELLSLGEHGEAVFALKRPLAPVTREDANSTAANRFAFASDITVQPNQGVHLWYDSTTARWRRLAGASKPSTVTVLTSGSGTYTTPTGATRLRVRLVGAGGSGSGSGTSAGAGSGGGNTTFSTLTGFGGGGGGNTGEGGTGGNASGGDINIQGQGGSQTDAGLTNQRGADQGNRHSAAAEGNRTQGTEAAPRRPTPALAAQAQVAAERRTLAAAALLEVMLKN